MAILARKRFEADDWQTMMITAAVPTLMIMSIFWGDLLRRITMRRYLLIHWALWHGHGGRAARMDARAPGIISAVTGQGVAIHGDSYDARRAPRNTCPRRRDADLSDDREFRLAVCHRGDSLCVGIMADVAIAWECPIEGRRPSFCAC